MSVERFKKKTEDTLQQKQRTNLGTTEALQGIKNVKGEESLFEEILIGTPLKIIGNLIEEVQKAKLKLNTV